MSELFISHNSADNAITREVFEALKVQGHHSVYLDFDPEQGIPAGRDWEQELYRELRTCEAMIVLCSENSMGSKWCFAEITHAKALGKPVFPILIASCTVSPLLDSLQIIDLTKNRAEGYQRLWRGLSSAGIDPRESFEWDKTRSPYPGLTSFQEVDAAVFFGRAVEIRRGLDLLGRLRRYGGAQAALIVGPAGIGKSSLIRAGLIPRLRRDKQRWIVVGPFRPGVRPQHAFAISIGAAFESLGQSYEWGKLEKAIQGEQRTAAADQALTALRDAAAQPAATVVCVVDQAEELLLASSEDGFMRLLASGFGLSESCVVVLTVRTDLLARFQKHPVLGRITTEDLRVGPLGDEAIREIVEKPAALAGIELGEGLTSALVDDAESADALPLLAFTLRQLYERFANDRKLELVEYRDAMQGLSGAIARAAEGVLTAEQLTAAQILALRGAFLSLAGVTEDGEFVRASARMEDLDPDVHGVLERFADEHLLVIYESEEGRIVEAAHNALLRSWPRLRRWLDEDREFLLWRKRIAEKLEEWKEAGAASDGRLSGLALQEALDWQERRPRQLSGGEVAFIATSQRFERRNRTNRYLRYGASLVLVIALVVTGALLKRAVDAGRIAAESRDTAFLDVLGKSEVFPLDEIIDPGIIPGVVEATPGNERAWVQLVGVSGKQFIIGRSFGTNTPGRIMASGHESLDFANAPFARTALTWLQGDGNATVGVSTGHAETIAEFADSHGIRIQDAMVAGLESIRYEVSYIDDLAGAGALDDIAILIIGNAWSAFSSDEIAAVERFVRRGRGLFATGLGWSWQDYGPDPSAANETPADLDQYPMNQLMRPFGMQWGEGKIQAGLQPLSTREELEEIRRKLDALLSR